MNNKYRLVISVTLIISVMAMSLMPIEPTRTVSSNDWVLLGIFIGVLLAIAIHALLAITEEYLENEKNAYEDEKNAYLEYKETFQVELYDWENEKDMEKN